MSKNALIALVLVALVLVTSCSDSGGGTPQIVDIDNDGIDDGIDPCIDVDGDDFGDGTGCLGPDCDDFNAGINPSKPEICDGFDNDCDGETDEDFSVGSSCLDGESPCGTGVVECTGLSDPATVCSTEYGGSDFDGSHILIVGDSVVGVTIGRSNLCSDYNQRVQWPGPDVVYAYAVETTGVNIVSLTNLTEELDLLLLQESCLGASCTDTSMSSGTTDEQIVFSASAGEVYYFVIDSRNSSIAGGFTINLTAP